MKHTKLIGLGRHAGSGKDTVCQMIQEMVPANRYAFADALKEEVAQSIEITVPYLEKHKAFYRETLQMWGQGRREADPEYWIAQVAEKIQTDQPEMAVITDCRYRNEVDWLRSQGGIYVCIDRPGHHGVNGHASEHNLDDTAPDYVIANAGDLNALRARVKEFLTWYSDWMYENQQVYFRKYTEPNLKYMTWREWSREKLEPSGVMILDPDGFRRLPDDTLYLESEFDSAAMECTMVPIGAGWGSPSNQ